MKNCNRKMCVFVYLSRTVLNHYYKCTNRVFLCAEWCAVVHSTLNLILNLKYFKSGLN